MTIYHGANIHLGTPPLYRSSDLHTTAYEK